MLQPEVNIHTAMANHNNNNTNNNNNHNNNNNNNVIDLTNQFTNSMQHVGPYRLEKTLGKGQTGT